MDRAIPKLIAISETGTSAVLIWAQMVLISLAEGLEGRLSSRRNFVRELKSLPTECVQEPSFSAPGFKLSVFEEAWRRHRHKMSSRLAISQRHLRGPPIEVNKYRPTIVLGGDLLHGCKPRSDLSVCEIPTQNTELPRHREKLSLLEESFQLLTRVLR